MRYAIEWLKGTVWFSNAFEWGRLITITGGSQLLVQALGLISGILVIRLLPTTEYALYVLANTMIGTMTVLADGGVSTGVMSRGGQVWGDRKQLGVVLVTGLALRKRFAIVSSLVSVPLMVILLRNHHAGWITCLLIVVAIIPSFVAALSGSILQVAPRLKQDVVRLAKNQLLFNLMRLTVLAGTLVFLPFAVLAILAGGLPQMWANMELRKMSFPYADWKQKPDVTVKKDLMRFVRKLLPTSIYYCLSGQITIWLISIFGSTNEIAHLGALTRLSMLLGLFNMVLNTLVVPRYARLAEEKKRLLSSFLKVQLFLFCMSCIVVAIVWVFGQRILWVLGEGYYGLSNELLLAMVSNCLHLTVGINALLNSSRGWLIHPVVYISLSLLSIVAGLLVVDVSTLRGVLLFNLFIGVAGLFIHPLFGLIKILTRKT